MPVSSAALSHPLRLCCALLLMTAGLHAPDVRAQQRNPLQMMGETVADQGSEHYRFEQFVVSSADTSRRWRINLAIPKRAAPKAGWPVLYLLDGNAALMNIDAPMLAEMANKRTAVLVFVGYDNALRIDSPSRTRDYTAWADTPENPDGQPTQVGGGADAFLEVIERQVKPEVERRARIDTGQQTLWGHSLGGLFVLHALYTRTGSFQTYAPASPSLWWHGAVALREPEQRFIAHNAGRKARVLMMLGGDERSGERGVRDMSNPRVTAHLKRITAAAPDAAMTLSTRLADVPGLQVTYREFPGLGHGPMLRASLLATLSELTGITDRSGETP